MVVAGPGRARVKKGRTPFSVRWAMALLLWGGSTLAQQPGGVEVLPPLRVAPPAPTTAPANLPENVLPLSLDTVFRLAQDRNGQIQIARAKLDEALLKQDQADSRWLPDVAFGPSFYRHEGGIQDFDGNLVRSSYGSVFAGLEMRGKLDLRDLGYKRIDAERHAILRRTDLVKLTTDQLYEAAGTYIDLMAAHSGVAICADTERRLAELVGQARKLADIDPGLRVEVVRVDTELEAQRVLNRKFREGQRSAQLKLLYLLSLDQDKEIALLEQITLIQLVDAKRAPADLVDEALRNGPGVAEVGQLMALIDRDTATRRQHLIPTVEVSMAEGGFGAGPGRTLDWDNRFDLGVHLRWSLNDLLGGKHKQRVIDVQRHQLHLTNDELRARLTLGVKQAFEELASAQDQISLAMRHIRSAEESYDLSNSRLRENIRGRSPSEVLLAARALFAARLNYLHAVRDYDKAQIRLFILSGAGCGR